jgi:tetratricopeptide (TPR) repeat protein
MQRLFVPLLGVILTATGVHAQSNPFDALRNSGDPKLYDEHKAQWLARVEALPQNVDVLEGAADFFMIRDRPLAQELLERARALEPNSPRWPAKLAQLHRLNANRGDQTEARLALVEMERAYAMTPANERSLPTGLAQTAFEAGDLPKARAFAEQLLDLAKASPKSWDYGNAIHKGNMVLGRIAVREGRIVDAVGLLRASGETPGSPQLNSFGPNMSLAKDLLEQREIDAVVAYLEQCRVFWKMGGEKLDAWVREVKAGRVPNFGANLNY